jgi:tetratricopeptide (TPR) repeat protein
MKKIILIFSIVFTFNSWAQNNNAKFEKAKFWLDNEKFEKVLEETNELEKNDSVFLLRAISQLNLQNYSEALKEIQKGIDLNQRNQFSHATRALIYANLGDYPSSIYDIKIAFRLSSNEVELYSTASEIYFLFKEYDVSLKYINEYINSFTPHRNELLKRGWIYFGMARYVEALNDFENYIDLGGFDQMAFLGMARSYDAMDEKELAIFTYNLCVEMEGIKAISFFYRGIFKADMGDRFGATLDFNKAIRIDPNKFEYYYFRGIVNLENHKIAIPDFNKTIDLNPNYPEAYYGRGLCKLNVKDYNGACTDFRMAAELGFIKAYDVIKKYCN